MNNFEPNQPMQKIHFICLLKMLPGTTLRKETKKITRLQDNKRVGLSAIKNTHCYVVGTTKTAISRNLFLGGWGGGDFVCLFVFLLVCLFFFSSSSSSEE